MTATPAQPHEKEIRDAEELLFTGPQKLGIAKGLFLGRFVADWVMPYPTLPAEERAELDLMLPELRRFLDEKLDPVAIDRNADIPREVIDGLGRLGVLGMTAPVAFGGRGFSQMANGRVLEEIGARCAATSVFVNAHHSIGIRALLLFGTPEQKRRWLPALACGEQLAAFALTEPEAGSDAANVQTHAELSADGSHYLLSGEKRYITNAAIAQVLTVMARTPEGITAFLVTPDLPGFRVVEPRMEKLGIRGTATGRLAFRDLPVPRENLLGLPGKGLKVALSVLDFGRTTFGACCTGAAKTCLRLATHHARTRRQFGHPLGDFELIKLKIARMAASAYAMEAMTTVTASLIDRGLEDYMLETAMLKVFTTEALWQIVNDAFQIHGGAAYFTDLPLERMLRDARINQIGEGANEVLTTFIALVGMRGPGLQLKEIWDALHHPMGHLRNAWRVGWDRAGAALHAPEVPVRSDSLRPHAHRLSRHLWRFNLAVDRALIEHREEILDRQYVQGRIAGAAMELFASACVLSRWDADLQAGLLHGDRVAALFLRESSRRTRRFLAELRDNDDEVITAAAEAVLRHEGAVDERCGIE
ncbi:MAG: acyl-CoA dehydrogenase family er 9 [Chthoniobacter sp.]|jgi:alkylation response protein AidB-like acyl-CoA dehydrogenase|nr:acyl-CoA dehydrogenase family er 9 [Chthoniobacter sp.]